MPSHYENPNISFLNGKYENGEIDYSRSTFAVYDPEFFAQDSEADDIIEEIYDYWIEKDVTQQEAFDWWVSVYLA